MKLELEKSISILKKSGIILYPSDTFWALGCDATNYEAVTKIFKLKQETLDQSYTCLVSDFKMLQQYVEEVPEIAFDILKFASKPTTIILDRPNGISENLISNDNTLALRVVRLGFAHQLIKRLRRPLLYTTANLPGKSTPNSYKEISEDILKGVDYVVNLQNEIKRPKPSAIIKLSNDGMVQIIRK